MKMLASKRFLGISLLCALLLVSHTVLADVSEPSASDEEAANVDIAKDYVVDLTDKDVKAEVAGYKIAMVKFIAPWCKYCQMLAKDYADAAKKLHEEHPDILMATVDCIKNREQVEKFEIVAFPTIKVFRGGLVEKYEGSRNANGLYDHIVSLMKPSVVVSEDIDNVVPDTNSDVVYIGKLKNDDDLKFFETVADRNRNVGKFYANVNAKQTKQYIARRKHDGDIIFTGDETEGALEKFVAEEWFPYFGEINKDNYSMYSTRNLSLIWFAGVRSQVEEYRLIMAKMGKNFRGKASFVYIDCDEYAEQCKDLKYEEGGPPSLVCQRETHIFQFPDSESLNDEEALRKFLEDFVERKMIKSEPIPEGSESDVVVVVGNNFKDVVMQSDKDVMLEIYSPACGHCKRLEPVYNDLAAELKEKEGVVIAKMDGTANEIPMDGFHYDGFPTIFFVKAGETQPIVFGGNPELQDLKKFVLDHSTKHMDSSGEL